MNEDQALYAAGKLVDLVPQWYRATYGPIQHKMVVNGSVIDFYSHTRLSTSLDWLLNQINTTVDDLVSRAPIVTPLVFDLLQEHYAIEWLRHLFPSVNWHRVIQFLSGISRRTSENSQVCVNLVFSSGVGSLRLDRGTVQRVVDQLANSQFTFIRVDGDLQFLDYCEIAWSDLKEPIDKILHPGFLHPIHSVLEERECSVHVTSRGDIVVMDQSGLVASRRKGGWKLYDVRTLKEGMGECLGNIAVADKIFGVLFDLSFRRHGALLVFDPSHSVINKVVNVESVLDTEWSESGQRMIAALGKSWGIGRGVGSLRWRRQLTEIASVDGAVIFDENEVLAFGSVIQSHSNAGGTSGARSTAALSAYYWGGFPIKVSSDGEITFYFTSTSGRNECGARMEFL